VRVCARAFSGHDYGMACSFGVRVRVYTCAYVRMLLGDDGRKNYVRGTRRFSRKTNFERDGISYDTTTTTTTTMTTGRRSGRNADLRFRNARDFRLIDMATPRIVLAASLLRVYGFVNRIRRTTTRRFSDTISDETRPFNHPSSAAVYNNIRTSEFSHDLVRTNAR